MKTKNLILEIIILLLLLLWVYAALSKWINHQAFYRQLSWNPTTDGYQDFLFYFLPGIELLAVLLLLIRPVRLYGLWLSAGLLFVFTAYVFYVVFIDPTKATCTCGGVLAAMTWKQHLIFNISFLVMSVAGIYLYKSGLQNHQGNIAMN
nr:MauE/DoxX family redox-associated membrane protein [Pedobacter sp. ASV2]